MNNATPEPEDRPDSPDRRAIEHLLERPLSREWPAEALPAGSRVTVTGDGGFRPWQQDFTATIDDLGAPEPVTHPLANDGELSYWVQFDTPQYDSSGDGPYRKALIWGRYLRHSDL